MRRSPLKRRTPLRAKRKPLEFNIRREAWKARTAGVCECGCGRFSFHLHRHHVLLLQTVRREGADSWALANSMLLHPDCHAAHHSGFRKIAIERVPESAVKFAVGVLGEARAADYFARRYDCPATARDAA